MSDPVRKLNIVNCRTVYTGTANTGKPYTIYEVDALTADGAPVQLPLRAFDDLPRGLGDFYVSDYVNKKGEKSYTLKSTTPGPRTNAGPSSSSSSGETAVLRNRIELLEQQAGWAIAQINGLKALVAPLVPAQPAGVAAPGIDAARAAFGGDDDVPF